MDGVTTAVPVAHGLSGRRMIPGGLWYRAFLFWLASYRRTWRGSMVTGFLAPLLYLGSLGFGLGTLVDRGTAPGVDGVPYAVFVAPGVLAATAMQTAVGESTYPVMGAVKWQRQYLAMLAAPLGVVDVLIGHVAFVVLRVALVSAAFAVVGGLLGAFASPWVVLAVPVAVICGVAHAAPIMAYAVRQDNDGGFNLLYRFGVIPMFLFAGTFFPVDQLPGAIRPLAWAAPLWHATEVCRDLSLGRAELVPSLGHVIYLSLWIAVGLWLAGRAFRKRLVL